MGFAGFIAAAMLGCGGVLPPPVDTAAGHEPPLDEGIPHDPAAPEACARHIAPPAAPSTLTPDALVPRRLPTEHRTGRCLAVDDLDQDGSLDILTITRARGEGPRQRLEVWWGGGPHTATPLDGLPHPNDSCTLSDLDGDGDLDLLTGDGTVVVAVENQGDRSWAAPAVLLELGEGQDWLDLIARVDLDGTGPLDLLVATGVRITDPCVSAESDPGDGGDVTIQVEHDGGRLRCFVGTEDGGFVAAGADVCPAGLGHLDSPQILGLHAADLTDDGRPDLFVAADFAPNLLLTSRPGGLEDASAGSGVTGYDHAMGTAMADWDGDGLRDLYVTDVGPDGLYLAAECAVFYDAALARGTAAATDRTVSWGATAQDFDLDGDLDVFATVSVAVGPSGFTEPICEMAEQGYAAPGPMLHVAEGDGAFTHLTLRPGEGTPPGQWYAIVAAMGDVDGDGDVDVVTSSERAGLHVWENRAERAGAWLGIRPMEGGAVSLGARVVVRQPDGERVHDLYGTFGTGGHSELRAWFGLGPEPGPVDVDIRWPDGSWSTWPEVAVDQHIDLAREAVPPPLSAR